MSHDGHAHPGVKIGDPAVPYPEEAKRGPSADGKERGRVRQVLYDALRDEWDGLDRIYRDIRLADLFTILNALMGFTALILAAHVFVRGGDDPFQRDASGALTAGVLAVHLVFLGIIMDGVDGAVARMGKGGGPLGGTLDTLADTTTFCVTPAVLAYVWLPGAGSDAERALYWIPLALYLVCGLLRLARFESLRDDGKKRYYFSGIPTPAGAGTMVALMLVDVPPAWLLVAALYLAILMVSRIRYPKLRGWWGVTASGMVLAVLVAFNNPQLQRAFTWALLAFMAVYVLLGPFYVLARYGPTKGHA